MNFYVLTLFPEMITQALNASILGRGMASGCIHLEAVNIRDYTENKHKKVDDYPYGGGAGMLMQAQPVYDAFLSVKDRIGNKKIRVIYMTPQGRPFSQKIAEELAQEEELLFLCGHYEGIDERVLEEVVTDYLSIGDYVLTGGELPAMVTIDAIARLVPGVLNNESSAGTETFHMDLLEYPQYSRPEEWRGHRVPPVLLSGDRKKIEKWHLKQSEERTKRNRPDLYEKYLQKQTIIALLLKKNKLLYIDIIENLRRGRGELLYAQEDGVIVYDRWADTYMAAIWKEESSDHMMQQIAVLKDQQVVLHQECLLASAQTYLHPLSITPIRQMTYTENVMLPVSKKVQVQPLGIESIQTVMDNYTLVPNEAYMLDRLISGNLFGAFMEGTLTGFAGIHKEGSMGMLQVFSEYKRKGIGTALETYIINKQLSEGLTPYADMVEGNVESLEFHKKLGLKMAKDVMYWTSF